MYPPPVLLCESGHKGLDEPNGLRLIDDIHQEGADDRNDHHGFSGHTELFVNGRHIDDGTGCGTKSVSAQTGAHDRCIIVFAEDAEDDEVRNQDHERDLADEDDEHAAEYAGKFPEFECHERNREIQREHDVSDLVIDAVAKAG